MSKTLTQIFSKNDLALKLFNKAVVTGENTNFEKVNKLAVVCGYLVHPSLCTPDMIKWLKNQTVNYNATFYKKWNDIISKNRFELFIDQILHYASTYGTNYEGEVYLPEGIVEAPSLTDLKVIQAITTDELISRCENMLFSGIALKQDTIEDILAILNELNHSVDINKVKNKEAKMFLHKATNTVPTDAVEMVRYLVFLATTKSLLIKSPEVIRTIKATNFDISKMVETFGYDALSSVFFRFKPLFLAFRTNFLNRKAVNKLRRLANANHKPMTSGYFESLLSDKTLVPQLVDKLAGITNFKKITLLQTINVRLKNLTNRAFVVRNQKLYMKDGAQSIDSVYLKFLFDIIYSDLVESLKDKATSVSLPKGIALTLPTSEKSFVGNYPLGTSFDFSDSNNIVGIYWKGVDGAHDLDLKLIDIDGRQFGWNAAYKNENDSVVFSGDMTSANPEATELFFTSKGFKPSIVKVNLYNGATNSKFKFFIAKEKITKMDRNYMVDPNNVLFTVDCEMDSSEKSLGVITDSKFVLAQFRTGRGRVASNSVTDLYTTYALSTLDCYISLEKLLVDAGFTLTDENPTINLNELSKDTLMDLLK